MAGPPSEASLHVLVDKAVAAKDKRRWARAADLYKRAALQASALFPHDSLVIVNLQSSQAHALEGQSRQTGLSVAEQRALHEEAWAHVREGMEVVSRRHASATLGYNKCRPDEVQFETRFLTSRIRGEVDAAQRARLLEVVASNVSCFGVSVAGELVRNCLYRLQAHPSAFRSLRWNLLSEFLLSSLFF